LNPYALTGTGT